jgi:hypothetical protein
MSDGFSVLKGRRLPVTVDDPYPVPEIPGDYTGPVYGLTGDKPCVRFLKPNARYATAPRRARSVQHVVSPPHTFTEEPDGSLTISASISDRAGPSESDGWHGYLIRGWWVLNPNDAPKL